MIGARPGISKEQNPPEENAVPTIQVLYIDDEPDLLEIGKRFLERTGTFSVRILTSAEEGLTALEGQLFDVIVSDYQMPEKDGITFLKELRDLGDQTPFILFTGKGREEVAVEAYEHGADHYVQKGGGPRAQFADLAHKIRRCVEKRVIEEKNRTLTRRLDFIRRVNKALARSRDWDELLVRFCDLAIQYGNFELCWAGFIDPEESMVVPYIARSSRDKLPEIPEIRLSNPKEGRGDDPCGDALIRGGPYACNDTYGPQKTPKWSEWAQAEGYNSFCSVPLRLYEDLFGAFMIFSKQSGFFDVEQIEMLTEMGADISFELSSFEGDARHQRAEDLLPTNESRHQTQDLDHLLGLIDQAADGILLTDEEGMVRIWNKGMERITGLSKNQAQGLPLGAVRVLLNADNDQEEYQQILQMFRNDPSSSPKVPTTSTLITSDGEVKQIETIWSVVPTEGGFRLQSIVHEIFSHPSTSSVDSASDLHSPEQIEDRVETIRHNLLNQLTALNCYTEILIEENRGTGLTASYLEKISEISMAIQDQINLLPDHH